MSNKAIIIALDDDPQVLRAVTRDLRSRYRKEYRIISSESANEVLELLPDLKKKSETVALFLVDQRMPEMIGVEFLEKAKDFYPEAKRALLTAYSDTEAAIRAINEVQLDYYLMKPWDPPEEKLFPVVDELLDDWKSNVIPAFKGIRILGVQYSPKSHELKDFLRGNLIPYQWIDFESNLEAKEIMNTFNIQEKDLPVVITSDGTPMIDPSIRDVATEIGLQPDAKESVYDVIIIGAGPAGLAAAVYGASEGLNTLLIEKRAPGGQAGTSSRIENYLGFPNGLSGADLTRRAISQAKRFGAEFLSPQEVKNIEVKDGYKIVHLVDGTTVKAKCIVVTTGVDYRKLDVKGVSDFTGAGVYYGAAMTEAAACANKEVYISGGGNSAGQAAMYVAKYAKSVTILIRRESLTSSMSQYLIDQIDKTPNITVSNFSEVVEAQGDTYLEKLHIKDRNTEEVREVTAHALFVFIGARPYTDWLESTILKTDRGFIETGKELMLNPKFKEVWKEDREPALLETCSPGIFAAGDVRAGAMNRVASAVGEGAMSIKMVHEYLAEN